MIIINKNKQHKLLFLNLFSVIIEPYCYFTYGNLKKEKSNGKYF